jgi:hypothetical protein
MVVKINRQAAVSYLRDRGFHPCAGGCLNHFIRRSTMMDHAYICQSRTGEFEVRIFTEVGHDRQVLRAV